MKYAGTAILGALKGFGIGIVIALIFESIGAAAFGHLIFFASPFVGGVLAVRNRKRGEAEREQRWLERDRAEEAKREQEKVEKEAERQRREQEAERRKARKIEEQRIHAEQLESLRRALAPLSAERLRFERQVLKEKVDEAKRALERESDENEDFLRENGYKGFLIANCNRREDDCKDEVENAERALAVCEEILRAKL